MARFSDPELPRPVTIGRLDEESYRGAVEPALEFMTTASEVCLLDPFEHARPSQSLNVVFVTLADLPEGGGSTSRLKMLARATSECGHDVTLLNEHASGCAPTQVLKAAGHIGKVEYKYILGSVDRKFGLRSIGFKLRVVSALAKEIRTRHAAKKIDLLWFNHLSFYDTYPLTRLSQSLSIPTIQSYEDERFQKAFKMRSLSSTLFAVNAHLADYYCPRTADSVIVISRYLEQKYAARVRDRSKLHIVPTIVDCDYWDVGSEPASAVPVLLYAGTFSEQDEIENLLAAVSLLRSRGRSFRLVALGANRDSRHAGKLSSKIRDLHLGDVLELRGFVGLDEVKRQVAGANILLNVRRDSLWSRSGLSTKMSEYLASGRPVVCTDLGDVAMYVKHGQSAMLVPPTTTAEQIAAAIDLLLASPELRQKIGRAGREVAAKYFGLRAASEKIERIIRSAVSSSEVIGRQAIADQQTENA
jgi:glycosyltransferase involved in cell wall biosynthesis